MSWIFRVLSTMLSLGLSRYERIKALPFIVGKFDVIQFFQLHTNIGAHRFRGRKGGQELVALIDEVLHQLAFQRIFALVLIGGRPRLGVYLSRER